MVILYQIIPSLPNKIMISAVQQISINCAQGASGSKNRRIAAGIESGMGHGRPIEPIFMTPSGAAAVLEILAMANKTYFKLISFFI